MAALCEVSGSTMHFEHGSSTGFVLLLGAAQAYLCTARQDRRPSLNGRQIQELPMFVSYILAKVQAYFRYRETVRELSLLSDRELTDLGIARFQIDSIARQGAAA
jgi:uncharacterized protein YjiS (DUF1127 family)